MYFGTTIQFYKDKIMQSQYISSQTHTLQIRWRRVAPACREHFRGGEFRSRLLQVFAAARSPTKRSTFIKNIFADLVDQPKIRHIYNLQCHLPELAVGRHPSCAEVGIIVSARAGIPFQPSWLRSSLTRRQFLNKHTRVVQGPPLRPALLLGRPLRSRRGPLSFA
jgi:hypothetical protein